MGKGTITGGSDGVPRHKREPNLELQTNTGEHNILVWLTIRVFEIWYALFQLCEIKSRRIRRCGVRLIF